MLTSHPYIAGVDPGLKGAVAVLDRKTMELQALFDMPVREYATESRKSGKRGVVDGLGAAQRLYKYAPKTCLAAIEKVGARPGQGLGSTFNFGHGTGIITGVFNGFAVPTVEISPFAWKAYLGLTADKDGSRKLAQQLWPKEADLFKRKKDDGRAEACLIAYFCIKTGGKIADE